VLAFGSLANSRSTTKPLVMDIETRPEFRAVVHTLPNKEDCVDVKFMVVVALSVPKALLLDETYIHTNERPVPRRPARR
jgi:hypothetical protein